MTKGPSHLPHELSVNLGDPVDCPWPLDAEVGRWVPRGGRSESPDGAGDKQSQAVLGSDVENVVQPWEPQTELSGLPGGNAKRELPWAQRGQELNKQALGTATSTCDVDGSRQGDVGFPDGAEQRAVVEQPRDPVVHHDLAQVLVVQDVRVDKRT